MALISAVHPSGSEYWDSVVVEEEEEEEEQEVGCRYADKRRVSLVYDTFLHDPPTTYVIDDNATH